MSKGDRPAIISNISTPSAHQSTLKPEPTQLTENVIPSVMALKRLLNKTADTDRGVKTCESTLLEAVNKRFGGILSEPLYCVATMLDARYKDHYFDADKKQCLREMLQSQLDKMETDTVTVHTKEEDPRQKRPRTDRAETSLLDMYDEILVENGTTEQMNNETAQQSL
ncbi:unnamed protein product [Coregonus sp. 'balchen']|nr:unnamed protein product [Coregonus sp. 'balchen']